MSEKTQALSDAPCLAAEHRDGPAMSIVPTRPLQGKTVLPGKVVFLSIPPGKDGLEAAVALADVLQRRCYTPVIPDLVPDDTMSRLALLILAQAVFTLPGGPVADLEQAARFGVPVADTMSGLEALLWPNWADVDDHPCADCGGSAGMGQIGTGEFLCRACRCHFCEDARRTGPDRMCERCTERQMGVAS